MKIKFGKKVHTQTFLMLVAKWAQWMSNPRQQKNRDKKRNKNSKEFTWK